jgi:hypothetical protein
VIELDLGRLRANEAVGSLVTSFGQRAELRALGDLGFNPMLEADLLVLATYPTVETEVSVVLARGARMQARRVAKAREDAAAVDATTVVYGPEPYREQVLALARGEGKNVLGDEGFLRLRDQSIPEGAPGASLRATARFAFGRRIQLAGDLGIDEIPGTASVWGDVADDVAVIALLAASSEASARRLAEGLGQLYRRDWRRHIPAAAFEARAEGTVARVVFHVGPKALAGLKEGWTP